MLGRSIEERPAIANAGTEIGHWEVDTVVGRRQGREAVIFTAVEKGERPILFQQQQELFPFEPTLLPTGDASVCIFPASQTIHP